MLERAIRRSLIICLSCIRTPARKRNCLQIATDEAEEQRFSSRGAFRALSHRCTLHVLGAYHLIPRPLRKRILLLEVQGEVPASSSKAALTAVEQQETEDKEKETEAEEIGIQRAKSERAAEGEKNNTVRGRLRHKKTLRLLPWCKGVCSPQHGKRSVPGFGAGRNGPYR